MDEGSVEAPADDLASVGEGADGGGTDGDLDGCVGAGGNDGKQGEERKGNQRRKNSEGCEEGGHHARLPNSGEQDRGAEAGQVGGGWGRMRLRSHDWALDVEEGGRWDCERLRSMWSR